MVVGTISPCILAWPLHLSQEVEGSVLQLKVGVGKIWSLGVRGADEIRPPEKLLRLPFPVHTGSKGRQFLAAA